MSKIDELFNLANKFEKKANLDEDNDFVISIKSACHRLIEAASNAKLTSEEENLILSKIAELTLKLIHNKSYRLQ